MVRMLVVAGLLWSSAARAEPAREVTLAEALHEIGSAPAHRIADSQRAEAAAHVDAAGAWPATTIGASTTRKTPRLDVAATLPLPIFGTLGANRATAREELETAAAEVRAADLQLAREVAAAWFALARAEERAQLMHRSAARELEVVRAASERFAAGDASRADVVLATAAAKRVAAQAQADDAAIDVASAELAGLLGWRPDERVHASGGLPAAKAIAAPSVAVHPEQLVANRRIREQAARVTEASRARWPKLALELEAMIDDPTLPGTDYRAGIALELPLLGRTGAGVREAEAKLATAKLASAATQQRLAAELAGARAKYAAASAHAVALEDDVLPAQREAAELARTSFREGQSGLVLVLEAERALADAESEAIDARAEASTAFVELTWASGSAP